MLVGNCRLYALIHENGRLRNYIKQLDQFHSDS